ncbi:unnamed protein product, partial [Ectocarpus sp. 8 AP-2014]
TTTNKTKGGARNFVVVAGYQHHLSDPAPPPHYTTAMNQGEEGVDHTLSHKNCSCIRPAKHLANGRTCEHAAGAFLSETRTHACKQHLRQQEELVRSQDQVGD